MNRVTLALALAALSVPVAAGAAQANSVSPAPGKIKIHGTVTTIGPAKITIVHAAKAKTFARGAVALTGIRIGARVEAEGRLRNGVLRLSSIHLDDNGGRKAGSTQVVHNEPGDDRGVHSEPGDDRGGQTVSPAVPVSGAPADDHGNHAVQAGDDRGHGGQDDGPNHS